MSANLVTKYGTASGQECQCLKGAKAWEMSRHDDKHGTTMYKARTMLLERHASATSQTQVCNVWEEEGSDPQPPN